MLECLTQGTDICEIQKRTDLNARDIMYKFSRYFLSL